MSEHPLMRAYLAQARWFAGKGRDYDVVEVRRVATLTGPPAVTVDIVTVSYLDGSNERYQMPLSHYSDVQDRIAHAYVGPHADDELGPVHSYDAVHDREAMAVFLEAFAATEPGSMSVVDELSFFRTHEHELDTAAHSTLFRGEQSNSSVAFGDDSLLKVFRKVSPGRNPDIEMHQMLTEDQSTHVAALYGWVSADLPAPQGASERLDLAMIQQLLRTASDGWDLALASVRDLFAEADLHADEVGGDFAGDAERLGTAVAEVHAAVRHAFERRRPGSAPADVQPSAIASAMLARLDDAVREVPELADRRDAVAAIFARLEDLPPAPVQRVHGDLHLGQTLRVSTGWKLVDFEGEPAKSLAERRLPDSVWRDVAGMLRSFDYAARSVQRDFMTGSPADAQLAFRTTEWVSRNRAAFLAGYLAERDAAGSIADSTTGSTADSTAGRVLGPTADEQLLLDAYEADKAIYEAGYEARNRPSWIAIPLDALARLQHPTRPAHGGPRTIDEQETP